MKALIQCYNQQQSGFGGIQWCQILCEIYIYIYTSEPRIWEETGSASSSMKNNSDSSVCNPEKNYVPELEALQVVNSRVGGSVDGELKDSQPIRKCNDQQWPGFIKNSDDTMDLDNMKEVNLKAPRSVNLKFWRRLAVRAPQLKYNNK